MFYDVRFHFSQKNFARKIFENLFILENLNTNKIRDPSHATLIEKYNFGTKIFYKNYKSYRKNIPK